MQSTTTGIVLSPTPGPHRARTSLLFCWNVIPCPPVPPEIVALTLLAGLLCAAGRLPANPSPTTVMSMGFWFALPFELCCSDRMAITFIPACSQLAIPRVLFQQLRSGAGSAPPNGPRGPSWVWFKPYRLRRRACRWAPCRAGSCLPVVSHSGTRPAILSTKKNTVYLSRRE